ncbi:hypothetical protein ACM39_15645 [Chryseobacterium sp. FH2]|uniref:hypothetical protein n=1 Tax=Chryseobacterium sp. FH2 TaxID=1674291 RepID=UPI00065B04BC|nr:hypothetical protein [Chryseobacterium sp. FH2]KMQ67203.1 hypothetical protein ACM39_15645 [Chryseobacterium sp. FH2]
MKNLLSFFIVPSFLFCGFSQINNYGDNRVVSISSNKGKSQIGYLFFKVEKDNSGVEKVILQEKKVSEGKLKYTPNFDRNSANIGDFIITLTSADGKEIVKQAVEDPLNPVMENFEDNISRNQVSLQNAEFSIRYPHSNEIAVLKVEKITNAGNQLLLNQKL